jgi:hypothetical protein
MATIIYLFWGEERWPQLRTQHACVLLQGRTWVVYWVGQADRLRGKSTPISRNGLPRRSNCFALIKSWDDTHHNFHFRCIALAPIIKILALVLWYEAFWVDLFSNSKPPHTKFYDLLAIASRASRSGAKGQTTYDACLAPFSWVNHQRRIILLTFSLIVVISSWYYSKIYALVLRHEASCVSFVFVSKSW